MKKILRRLAVLVVAFGLLFGAFAPRVFAANGEYSQPECEGLFQDLTCTSLDHIAAFMSIAYETFVDDFLDIDPATFDYEYVGSPGHALHTAWGSMRNIANIAFVLLLFVVMLSQVTGIGISNYGIKKMMPRLVAGVLMVNLSYFICQGAIDLSNIFGAGLGSLFEDLMIDSIPPDIGFSVGNTALTSIIIAVVGFLVVKVKGLGTKVILLVILGILAILLAVFLLFVISVVRQALCILLVVFAPIAFVCYMMPGTKSIYNKWFSMFKGVLFAYPICSLLIYGGSYAGAVIYGTWVDNGDYGEVLRNLSFLLITTVPYFFIPSVIMKSLGAAESAVARLGGFLRKNSRGALERTRFMTDLNRRSDQERQLARAGYKFGKDGAVVKKWRPKKLDESTGGTLRKMGKKAFNSALRAQDKLNAPYIKNAVRVQSEERRANMYKKKLKDLKDSARSGYYVFDAASGKYKKIATPLTNRQLRKGMINGQKIFRIRDGVKKPNLNAGSTDLEHISKGETKRVKERIAAARAGEVSSQAQNLETAAWRAQIKNDNMGVSQISEAMKKMAADPKKMNPIQLSAYASALVADGAAGREALEELLADTDMQRNPDAIMKIAQGMTKAEMNSIKKKNPILFNKLEALQKAETGTFNVGDLSVDSNFEITEKQLDGLSSKHISEMDASAQKRVIESLMTAVEADANNLNNYRVVKALELAEGALNNPEIRATMSPEQIANLEQIRNMRRAAVESESAKTIRSDRSAIMATASAAGVDFSTVPTEDLASQFRDNFKQTFLENGANPGGHDGVMKALTNAGGCDTVRIEAITKAANAQLDEILRGRGMNGPELAATRDDIMRGVLEDMGKAIKAKSDDMLKNLNNSEDAAIASMKAAGASAEDIARREDQKKETMAAERYRLGASRTVCDVVTQRINLRS